MKTLNGDQLQAIKMRKSGSNYISIAKYLGFSHTLIGRWFSPNHYVNQAYQRYIDFGHLYPPRPKSTTPNLYNNDLADKQFRAWNRWYDKRMKELEEQLGPIPRLPREKRKAILAHYATIILNETNAWDKKWLKENRSNMSPAEIEAFLRS